MVAGSVRLGTRRGQSAAEVTTELETYALVPELPWVVGQRYDGLTRGGTLSTQAITANLLYANPVFPVSRSRVVGSDVDVDRIGIEVTVGAAAGKKLRVGLYALNETTGKPGALIVDAGELAADGIAFVEATIAEVLACGHPVFRALISDGTPTIRVESTVGRRTGATSGTDTQTRSGWSAALTYTAGVTVLPDPFPSASAVSLMPCVLLRAA